MLLHSLLFVLGISAVVPALAQAGTFHTAGNTQVSAMMMFVVSQDKVYILDKVEGNANQINGHSQYASIWDIPSGTATPIDVQTNAFCAAGMHLPNGSYALFGGNTADYDGTRAIRVFNACDANTPCSFYDNSTQLAKHRCDRWLRCRRIHQPQLPNTDPAYEGGAAEPTYEFFPPSGSQSPQVMNFMVQTSGLNSYALTYLMPSGKMFVQANYSTSQIIRVYPASGANAMLPLTPANNYTPTIIFCGGQYMDDYSWGNYSYPFANTWTLPASSDCHRITPEPTDGSSPAYVQDDDLPIGRTMGQFIALPDGTFLIINGGQNGTAGYAQRTLTVTSMPFGESLATGPLGQPAIYNPNAPSGSRWSTAGLGSSNIPRLYHSSAILLPDGSVMVAGSNPNIDVNLTTIYPTTYTAEYFYPPYFSAKTRPVPQNIPSTLSYGGNYFDITIAASSYSGAANDAADNTTIWLIRPGFTTHAMNMGQRILELNHTYTVESNGTIILHTAQPPANPNVFQPGPAMLFVTINGIPSNATFVIVGNGQVGTQPTGAVSVLPASVRVDSASGSAPSSSPSNSNSSGGSSHKGAIIAAVVAGIAAVGVLGAVLGVCLARRRRSAAVAKSGPTYATSGTGFSGFGGREMRSSDSSAFVPLQQANHSEADLMQSPYRDQFEPRASSQFAHSDAYLARSGTPR
ncbi:hypothetical protein BJV74DRAFT_857462 [Russula compacta]|nr:hypothetical protein BJV74DRAFT_857462 [Russula compacta]